MLPGQVDGAADLPVQLAPSHLSFSEFSIRPGNLGLFGALLQPHAKKMNDFGQKTRVSGSFPI